MFHVSTYGRFAGRLTRYADLRGYVPEAEDAIEDFDWPNGYEWTPEEWVEWKKAAARERERCDEALAAWREGRGLA
jgi:hypothetical protein